MNVRVLRRAPGATGERRDREGTGAGATPAVAATTWLVRLVLAVGGLNVIVLLAQARATIHSLDLNGDNAMSLVLPALSGQAPAGSVVTLGNHAYYEAWWFERLTVGLPHARAIWEVAPFVVEAAGIALVVWCAWIALGRLAALLTAAALLSITDGLRIFLAMSSGRVGLTIHAGAFLAALLIVGGARGAPRLSRGWFYALTVFTIAFGAAAATDQLIALTVVIPYMLAPCLWWWYGRSNAARRTSLYAIATGVGALIGSLVLTSIMHGEHIVHSPYPVLFSTVDTLSTNVEYLIGSWALLGDGSFFGVSVSGANLYTFAAGTVCLAALAAVLFALARRTYILFAREWPETPEGSPGDGRIVFIAFWALVVATDLGLYLSTQISNSVVAGSHYLLSMWIAVAALLGAFARSTRLRVLLLVGVAVFGLLTARNHIANGVPAFGTGPDQATAAQIQRFASAHGARVGYAQYLDAPVITWETALKARVYPIGPCDEAGTASGLCPFFIDINTWYIPRPHTRTFLVTDSRPAVTAGSITVPPAAFGKPLASAAFGAFTVYVYGDDIASALGPQT